MYRLSGIFKNAPNIRLSLGFVLLCLFVLGDYSHAVNIYVKSPFNSNQLFIAGNQEFGWWSGRQMVSQNDGWFQVTSSTNQGADILSVYPDLGRTSDLELVSLSTIYQNISGNDVYIEFTNATSYVIRDTKEVAVISSSVALSSVGGVSSATRISSSSIGTTNPGNGTDPGGNIGDPLDRGEHGLGSIVPDTLYMAYGDSVDISATGIKLSEWSGTDDFNQVNDSSIRVSPTQQSTYYLKSYSNLSVSNENSSFELPVYGNGVKIRPQDEIPGWRTTANDGKIEVWRNFGGVPAYEGGQFVELNAKMVGDLYQDITTIPGEDIIVEFAHRGRSGPDRMGLKFGPPGGPYTTVGEYIDGTDAWGFYQEVITIPAGQTQTRIFFTSNGYSSSSVGNFLDAVSYTIAQSSLDSVVVVVQYPMDVTTPLTATIHDDGDGIADSLKVSFDVALDEANRFDSVMVYWGQDSTMLSWDDFELNGNGRSVSVSKQQFSEDIYTGAKDAADQFKLSFYYSDLVYNTGTQMQKDLELEDNVGPVILSASVLNGDTQKLIVRYSEAVQTDFGDDAYNLVLYQMKDKDGLLQEYFYSGFSYTVDSANSEIYQLENMIHSQDSIRLHPFQGIMDLSGNRPHVENTFFRVESHRKLKVETAPFVFQVDVEPESPQFEIQMVDQDVSADEYSREVNQIGAKYDLDIHTYMQQFDDVDESLIRVKWQMQVYTTHGGFVGQETGELECYDGLYEGGCVYDDRSLFLSWNLRDQYDRKVGVGAYVIRVNIWLLYDDELVTKSQDLWTAGVRR